MKHARSTVTLIIVGVLIFLFTPGVGLRNAESAPAAGSGPGGVTTDLQLWLKANVGVTTSSGKVTGWADQSGIGNNAVQASPGLQPSYANTLNFNPIVSFSGAHNLSVANPVPVHEVIAVFKKTGGFVMGSQGGEDYTGYIFGGSDRVISGDRTPSPNPSQYLYVDADSAVTASQPNIFSMAYNATRGNEGYTANGLALHATIVNGGLVPTSGAVDPFTDSLYIGRMNNASSWFSGDIAEIIIYNVNLGSTDRHKVQSYLALKYGITLGTFATPVSYIDSVGTIAWDPSVNASYHNDVAGIGVDDGSDLSQLASRSVNSDSIVTITGSQPNITSGEYLVWGNDDGFTAFQPFGTVASVATNTTGKPDATEKLGRVWKAQETGDVGSTTVTFDVPAEIETGKTYCFLTDDDGDFTNGGTTQAECTVASSPVSFTHDFNTGSAPFFTLGRIRLTPTAVTLASTSATTGRTLSWSLVGLMALVIAGLGLLVYRRQRIAVS